MIMAAVLSLVLASPAPAPCTVADLMPAFWEYRDAARMLPLAEQERLFEERIRKPSSALYEGVFFDSPRAAAEIVSRALRRLPTIEAELRNLSRRLSAEVPDAIERFRETFPLFRCRAPIYLVYSAGVLDVATRSVSGEDAVILGIDELARREEPLSPRIAHELFRVYHRERVSKTPDAFYWVMWSEGLASYVSRRLNPEVRDDRICCLPSAAPIDAALSRVVAGALERLDSSEREDYRLYFVAGSEPIDIPMRSGYLLGYRIAAEAGKTRSLEELADMDPMEVRELVEAVLRQFEPEAR